MVNDAPAALPPRMSGTHGIGGWVCLRASLHACGKSRLHRDSISGPSRPWPVAVLFKRQYLVSYKHRRGENTSRQCPWWERGNRRLYKFPKKEQCGCCLCWLSTCDHKDLTAWHADMYSLRWYLVCRAQRSHATVFSEEMYCLLIKRTQLTLTT
jgi:hypothetical protein